MMINTNLKNFIKLLPQIFDEEDVLSDKFFKKIKHVVNFSTCNVCLLNNESLNVIYPENKKLPITTGVKNIDAIKKSLKIEDEIYITYLKVKEIVYGIVIFEKENFSDEEKDILTAFSQVLSYKIKDKELSEIFRAQLKKLSEAVNETKNAEKMKTEFISNISHELRTPLNAIIGFSELLANPKVGTLNKKQTDYIEDIRISSLHLLGMINEVLDISKIEAHSMQLFKTKFKISQVISETSNILYPLFHKKTLNFIQKITNDIEIYADFQKIQQILYNLLSNAIKFTPENGEIIIETLVKNNKLEIHISDTGIGIDKKNHKIIFEKFSQLNDNTIKKESSTGLGLTITKELVKMHSGTISLKSELNKGSTFIIKLPLQHP